jgi:hypothetical protein
MTPLLPRGSLDAIPIWLMWIDIIFSLVFYCLLQSWHSLVGHWFKEVSTNIDQLVFQVLPARDYLNFRSFLCVTEEPKVTRWSIWQVNRINDSHHCLLGEMPRILRPLWRMKLSVCATSSFLSTLRLVFVFSLHNSGAIMARKSSLLNFCSRARIILFVRSEKGLPDRSSPSRERSVSLNWRIHYLVYESEEIRSPGTEQSSLWAALQSRSLRNRSLKTIHCLTSSIWYLNGQSKSHLLWRLKCRPALYTSSVRITTW